MSSSIAIRRISTSLPLAPLSKNSLDALCSVRAGETKLGEGIRTLPTFGSAGHSFDAQNLRRDLEGLRDEGCRYALLGIEEDIGARANCGRGGGAGAWSAFLPSLCNMQDNNTLRGSSIALLGSVVLPADLTGGMATNAGIGGENLPRLRDFVAQLDDCVEAVAAEVLKCSGLELITVGGGHNNCLPLLRAASAAAGGRAVSVANLDPHSDLRDTGEGRHSGNGFSTALEEGCLGRYYLCGYHRRYNSAALFDKMAKLAAERKFQGSAFEDWLDAPPHQGLCNALDEAIAFFNSPGGEGAPRAIEVDLDAIQNMPTSACSPSGVTVEDARRFVRNLSLRQASVSYLHLAEGAPSLGGDEGPRVVGKTLAYLASDFMECREARRKLEK